MKKIFKFFGYTLLLSLISSCYIPNQNSDSSSEQPSNSVNNSSSEDGSSPFESSSSNNSSSIEESSTLNDSSTPVDSSSSDENLTSKINVTLQGYSFESAFFEWEEYDDATSYNVYCDGEKIDSELIRKYKGYYRADILGLTAKAHTIDIIATIDNDEINESKVSYSITPMAHIREGFAFTNGTSSGAYNDDGSLKENAKVLYVDESNKDSITMNVKVSNSKTSTGVGLQNILDLYKKGYEPTPLNIRCIGNITDLDYMLNGDIVIDLNNSSTTQGITLEGVGNDTTFNGFGLRIKNASNVEVRNIGFMNCNSSEGDNISLQQSNHHVWVHNCDLFYGHAGSDADQVKGDGALDVKKSTNVTLSFNHFFDSGKCNLQGMKEESTENYITYHHNWYDHSDSRHPRVRTCSVHVYNNYFDGNSKYGVGATMGSSIFVENNYFRNCARPMSISMQGLDEGTFSSEDGGIIKAFGNTIIGGKTMIKYSDNNTSFDYYDASSKDEVVPSNVVAKKGGSKYNNFDTSSKMYSYNATDASKAKDDVIAYAGRVQGGDFKWTFTNADDPLYDVNNELKAALVNYKGKVLSSLSGTEVKPDDGENENQDSSTPNEDENNQNPPLDDDNTLVFNTLTQGKLTSNLDVSSMFKIKATSDKYVTIDSSNATVDGISYTTRLRLEGAGNPSYRSIELNIDNAATIKVVALSNSTSNDRPLVLLDSIGKTIASYVSPKQQAEVLTYEVDTGGTYYIASGTGGINIYSITVIYK